MKKLFFAMAAMAAMLTSCSKDDTTTAPIPQRSQVTFTVNAPELSTRAGEGNGTTATKLEYVIYDLAEVAENGANQIKGTAEFENGSRETTVTVDLVEGRTYDAIFFAHAEGAPYKIDWTARTLTVNDALVANQEAYDAFYKYVPEFEITTAQYNVDVEMKRPFAQLNIGTNDFRTQAGQLIDAEKVQVTVSNIYKTLDLDGNGTATDVSDAEEVTYSFAPRMQGTIDAAGKEYEWLSMNYILVNDREMVGVKFEFTDKTNNGEQTYTRTYTSVPVERNYRTNIVGSILTSPTDFNVEILPGFEDVEMGQIDGVNYFEVAVATADELQDAIDAAPENQITVIKVTADIEGDVTVPQKPNVKIIISGASDTRSENKRIFKGMITVDGKSSRYETAGLTIKGLNFKAESISGDACIRLGDGTNATRYTNNVTVEDCTFDVPGAVGVKSYTGGDWNLTIAGCTATENAHSLAQLPNVEKNLIIKDCVANSKNGINLNQTPNVVIDNYTADVKGYAVRFGASSGDKAAAETYLIKNSSLKSSTDEEDDAVIVIRGTAANSTLNIENTTIEGDPEILNTATNAKIYIDGALVSVVSTKEALTEAINDPNVDTVVATEDISYANNEAVEIQKDLTLDANGNTITAGGAASLTPSLAVMGDYNVEIIDANVEGGFIGAYYGANVVCDGGSLKFTDGMSGRNCFYAASNTDKKSVITIKDVDVNMANASGNSYLCAHGNAVIYVEGGKFYGKPVGSSNPYVKEATIGSYTGEVIIRGGNFNFNPTEWVDAGYKATDNGDGTWTVSAE